MGTLDNAKKIYNQFSDKKTETKATHKEHPAIKYNNNIINESLNNIIEGIKKLYNRQGYIKADTESIIMALNNFNNYNNNNIPSQIQLTPKQLYLASKQGWSFEQLNSLSGYSKEEIIKKINQHMQNNV